MGHIYAIVLVSDRSRFVQMNSLNYLNYSPPSFYNKFHFIFNFRHFKKAIGGDDIDLIPHGCLHGQHHILIHVKPRHSGKKNEYTMTIHEQNASYSLRQ